MLGRFIKPVYLTSGLIGQISHKIARVAVPKHQSLSMSTSTNYHYHEKPAHAHDKLWKAERYLSVALLGVIPAAAVFPHPLMDHAVALSLVVHVHWGVEAIVTDYIRPSIFGNTIPKVSIAIVYILSSLTLGGLFMFNYTDVGLTQATRMLVKI